MSDTTAALRIDRLVAGYVRELPILHAVSLTVRKQSLTTIIGPNGAGKSTLIKAIAGLIPVSAGTVHLGERDITGIRPDQMGGLGVSYVPQIDNVFRTLTILENLLLVLRRVDNGAERLSELFAMFPPLEGKRNERAGALSGGQKQMLAVSMALASRPSVILMDEPSAGLAPMAAQEVLAQARALTAQGVSILLVEQNVKLALPVSDHCYILAEGCNQLDGPAADILADPVVGEIYLGSRRVGSA